MKKLLFGVWFIGTIFLLVEGYYIIINAVPYGLKIVSNVLNFWKVIISHSDSW